MKDYGIRVKVALLHGEAVARTKEALQAEGFGILSEIDIAEKLKEKLGVDYKRYVIVGACNPPLAYKALTVLTTAPLPGTGAGGFPSRRGESSRTFGSHRLARCGRPLTLTAPGRRRLPLLHQRFLGGG